MTGLRRLSLLLAALLCLAVPAAIVVSPAGAGVRQADPDDPCGDETADVDCGEEPEDPPTLGELIGDYYDEVVAPAIYAAADKVLGSELKSETITIGPIGPWPVQTRINLRLAAKDFTAAKGKLNLEPNTTGTLKLPLKSNALKKLHATGKLKVNALLDLVNDANEDSDYGDEQRYTLKGLKQAPKPKKKG